MSGLYQQFQNCPYCLHIENTLVMPSAIMGIIHEEFEQSDKDSDLDNGYSLTAYCPSCQTGFQVVPHITSSKEIVWYTTVHTTKRKKKFQLNQLYHWFIRLFFDSL